MRRVQLDKNAGSNKLRNQCNQQNFVECHLLPMQPFDLRNKGTDREVAEFAIQHNKLTVTFDRLFTTETADILAKSNPGVLLIHMDDVVPPRTVTRKYAMEILAAFKLAFPVWHTAPWQNTILEMSPKSVVILCSTTNPPIEVERLRLTDGDFATRLLSALHANANRLNVPAALP